MNELNSTMNRRALLAGLGAASLVPTRVMAAPPHRLKVGEFELTDLFADFERALASWRIAENRHQTIAEILIQGAAMREDDVGHSREVSVKQMHDLFRWRVLLDAREAPNVCKQDRYFLIDST